MPTQSTRMKVQALCLVLMLAGHEAVRVNEDVEAALSVRQLAEGAPRTEAEDTWKALNKKCGWSLWKRSCQGEGCDYRPLPLDVRMSDSCRITDDAMLGNSTTKRYLLLQSQLLSAKAKKYNDKCRSTSWWNVPGTMHCERRAMHMLRAMEFIAKAQSSDVMKSLSPEEATAVKAANQDALQNIAEALGEDGDHVLEFVKKMKGNAGDIRKDPKQNVNKVVKVLWLLLRGSEQQKKEALKIIDETNEQNDPENVPPATPEEEAEMDKIAATVEDDPEGARNLVDSVNSFEVGSPTVGSLLQRAAGSGDEQISIIVKGILFVVLVLLAWNFLAGIVSQILGIFLLIIFIGLMGCGLGTIVSLNDCGNADLGDLVSCEIDCMKDLIKIPINWVKEIGKSFGELFDN